MQLTLTLDTPPTILWPNRQRGHWAAIARARKQYRADCCTLTKLQVARGSVIDIGISISISAHFDFKVNRRRDVDGLISALKSGIDGITDSARVWADDSQVRWGTVTHAGGAEREAVTLTITTLDNC